jgi:hypothetical protein
VARGDGRCARPRPARVDHLARLGAPSAIGLDETSFLAATAGHPTLLVTGIMGSADRALSSPGQALYRPERGFEAVPAPSRVRQSALALRDQLDAERVLNVFARDHQIDDAGNNEQQEQE